MGKGPVCKFQVYWTLRRNTYLAWVDNHLLHIEAPWPAAIRKQLHTVLHLLHDGLLHGAAASDAA